MATCPPSLKKLPSGDRITVRKYQPQTDHSQVIQICSNVCKYSTITSMSTCIALTSPSCICLPDSGTDTLPSTIGHSYLDPATTILVAENEMENEICALGCCKVRDDIGFIWGLRVKACLAGRGLGTFMMNELWTAVPCRCTALLTTTIPSNIAMRSILNKLGYQPISTIFHYPSWEEIWDIRKLENPGHALLNLATLSLKAPQSSEWKMCCSHAELVQSISHIRNVSDTSMAVEMWLPCDYEIFTPSDMVPLAVAGKVFLLNTDTSSVGRSALVYVTQHKIAGISFAGILTNDETLIPVALEQAVCIDPSCCMAYIDCATCNTSSSYNKGVYTVYCKQLVQMPCTVD